MSCDMLWPIRCRFSEIEFGHGLPKLFLHAIIISDILDNSSSLQSEYNPDQRALTSEGGSSIEVPLRFGFFFLLLLLLQHNPVYSE